MSTRWLTPDHGTSSEYIPLWHTAAGDCRPAPHCLLHAPPRLQAPAMSVRARPQRCSLDTRRRSQYTAIGFTEGRAHGAPAQDLCGVEQQHDVHAGHGFGAGAHCPPSYGLSGGPASKKCMSCMLASLMCMSRTPAGSSVCKPCRPARTGQYSRLLRGIAGATRHDTRVMRVRRPVMSCQDGLPMLKQWKAWVVVPTSARSVSCLGRRAGKPRAVAYTIRCKECSKAGLTALRQQLSTGHSVLSVLGARTWAPALEHG